MISLLIPLLAEQHPPIYGIEVTWANGARLAAAIALAVASLQMLLMLSNYWHGIIPMKREITEGDVVAPPVFWTLSYHLLVFTMLVLTGISRVQTLFKPDIPITVSTFTLPFIGVGMVIVTGKFQKYYASALLAEIRRRDGLAG